jgi:hypothetical protein
VKRREFLIGGVCTVGALVVARSLIASPEPPTYVAATSKSHNHRLHGSARSGCAHIPGDMDALNPLMLTGYAGYAG